MKIIETNRLVLRNLILDDVNGLFEILSDKETMKYYPRSYSKEETKGWITRSLNSYQENGYGLWAVTLKENHQFIGQCGISNQNIDGALVPEIGYQINKDYWNKGYATEAAIACLIYGFEKLNFDEIFIHTYVKNLPSIRVAQKVGMIWRKEYDKILQKHNNMIMRHVVYSLKRGENLTL